MRKPFKKLLCTVLCVLMFPIQALAYQHGNGYFYEDFSSSVSSSLYYMYDEDKMTVSDAMSFTYYAESGNVMFGIPIGTAQPAIDKTVFEDTDNAVVFSYDVYIPYKTSPQSFAAYIGYQKTNDNSMPYTQYLARAGQITFAKDEEGVNRQSMSTVGATFDAVYGENNNMTVMNNLDPNIGKYKSVAIDLGLRNEGEGKWYNVQTVLEYDKTNKRYISSVYMNGQPIRDEITGEIAEFIYQPDAGMLQEIQNRKTLSFVYTVKCGSEAESGKDIKVDNIFMRTYNKTAVNKSEIPQTIEATGNGTAQVVIPFKEETLSVPGIIPSGIMNIDEFTAEKINVYCNDKDITSNCSFESNSEGSLLTYLTDVYKDDAIEIRLNNIKDIRGQPMTDAVSFTITGDEAEKLSYENEYYYEDFSDYDGRLFNQGVNNYYTNVTDTENVYSLNLDSKLGNGVKIVNNTGAEKLFNGPRSNDGSMNFKVSPNSFENQDGTALVYSFDSFITPGIDRKDRRIYGVLDATGDAYSNGARISISPIFMRYWKGYDIFYTTQGYSNGIPVPNGGNTTDYLKESGTEGRWVNMQSVVRYDKATGEYITTHYVDGKPICNATSNEISEVRVSRSTEQVNARTSFGMGILATNATTDPVEDYFGVDNMSIRQYRKTVIAQDDAAVNSKDRILTIPVSNGYQFTNPYAPKQVTGGILNTDTINENAITVKRGDTDITASCVFSDSTYDKIRIKLSEAIGTDVVTVSVNSVKDILGETVSGQVSFSGTSSVTEGSLKLVCEPVYHIFEGNESVEYTLNWTESEISAKTAAFEIHNYYDEMVCTSTEEIPAGVSSYLIKIPYLEYGSYTLKATMNGETVSAKLAVVPKLTQRRLSRENGFGLAAMTTHSGSFNKNHIDDYAKSIVQAGFGYTREFGLINEMEPIKNNPDIWLWNANNINYDKIVDAYHKHGIGQSFMISGGTAADYYNGYTGGDTDYDSPTDLIEAYQFSKALAEHYQGKVDMFEIGNEVDSVHNSPMEGADTYTAFLKAAAVGIMDGNPNAKVASMGLVGDSAEYRRMMLENDIADYIDAYNYHSYTDYKEGNLQKYDTSCVDYHTEMERYGLKNKEVAVTEQGYKVDRGTESAITAEQEKAVARYGPTSMITAKATGTDLNLWFKHGYFIEDNKDIGTMSEQNQPYPVYSALSAMNHAIGNGKYIGKLKDLPAGSYAYCFKDGEDTVVCIWSDTEEGASVTVTTDALEATLIDIMGNEKPVTSFTVNACKDIQYLRFSGDITEGLSASVQREVEQSKDISDAERVVLQQRFPKENSRNAKVAGYQILNGRAECTLRVFNLNDREMTGEIIADVGDEWQMDSKRKSITVQPMSYADVVFTISSDGVVTQNHTALRFVGVFDGQETGDSVSSLSAEIPLKQEISTYTDPAKWTPHNASTEGVVTVDGDEVTFSYDMSGISADNGWTAEYLELPADFSFTENDGIVLSCKGNEITDSRVVVYLTEGSGEVYSELKNVTLSDSWQQISIPFADFGLTSASKVDNGSLDLSDISKLRIGFAPTPKGVFSYTLKNIGLYKNETNIDKVFVDMPEIVHESDKVYCTARIKNYNDVPITGTVFVTVRDKNNCLEFVKMLDYTATANKIEDLKQEITLTEKSETVSVLFWEGVEKMIPKSRNVSVGIGK